MPDFSRKNTIFFAPHIPLSIPYLQFDSGIPAAGMVKAHGKDIPKETENTLRHYITVK